MKFSGLLRGLGGPVAYYPGLARKVGGVKPAVFLCQLMYWSDKTTSPDGVFKSVEEWEEETGLSYREQATARKELVSRNLIAETFRRLEHRIYFLLNEDVFENVLSEIANDQKRISPTAESAIGGMRKAHFDHTENTSKTTSKNLTSDGEEKFAEFWKLYPKKQAKKEAQKAWKKVNPKLFGTIMDAIAVQRHSDKWLKDGGQYIPNAASWLNGERWEDFLSNAAIKALSGNGEPRRNEWEQPTRAEIMAKGPRSDGKIPHDKWDSGIHQFVFPLSDDIDPRMVNQQ